MKHVGSIHERSPDVAASPRMTAKEMLMPSNLPEAGFQSYEMLKNDAFGQREAFIAGDIVNPSLEYSEFKDLSALDSGIQKLNSTIETIRAQEPDGEKADIIASSLEFRIAEMEYIKVLAWLDFLVKGGHDKDEVHELLLEAGELGEQLYGKPEAKVRDAAFVEMWYQLDGMELPPSAQVLYDELNEGFTWGDRQISGIPRPDSTERLPDINDPALAWAGEVVLEKNANIAALIKEFWKQKQAESGTDYTAPPVDIHQVFVDALQLMDPQEASGVSIILDPNATALSWETPLMAVKVGANREPINSEEELLQKVFHELVVHGRRSINGLASELPVLGTGLYTETTRADYLTFEEGFASIIEAAIGAGEQVWDGLVMGRYLDISLAESGADFRETYEKSWRYLVLLDVKDGAEIDSKLLEKHKKSAYQNTTRIFRGTPVDIKSILPDEAPLTFNKDLAYLSGRVLAIEHIKMLYETKDIEGLMRLFTAKYDPTIPEQNAIVEKYARTPSL